MSVKELQELINEYYYWDARATHLACNYFADEIELVYEDSKDADVVYQFIGCYKSIFDHCTVYEKYCSVKEMTYPQIPYFLQDVEVGEVVADGRHFITCKICMYPLDVEIWCQDMRITKRKRRG